MVGKVGNLFVVLSFLGAFEPTWEVLVKFRLDRMYEFGAPKKSPMIL